MLKKSTVEPGFFLSVKSNSCFQSALLEHILLCKALFKEGHFSHIKKLPEKKIQAWKHGRGRGRVSVPGQSDNTTSTTVRILVDICKIFNQF